MSRQRVWWLPLSALRSLWRHTTPAWLVNLAMLGVLAVFFAGVTPGASDVERVVFAGAGRSVSCRVAEPEVGCGDHPRRLQRRREPQECAGPACRANTSSRGGSIALEYTKPIARREGDTAAMRSGEICVKQQMV